ncbi:UNKNOWN [Stylonychia lemnae]|uniref:Uncharacterized protein n=1 Tax=Stylonychia lemnae TaxID=5949 RepID=A0A078A3G0_STYLE|nr:UNKNOWN [Stylonychia lemnae]|eukprot:CDW76818.1 UNKNOWN [Stylonychia lemnae]
MAMWIGRAAEDEVPNAKLDESKDEELKLQRQKDEAKQKKQRDDVFKKLQNEQQQQIDMKNRSKNRYLQILESKSALPSRQQTLKKEDGDQGGQDQAQTETRRKRKGNSRKKENGNKVIDLLTYKSKDKIFGVTSREKMHQIQVAPPQSPPVGLYQPNFLIIKKREEAYLTFDPPQSSARSRSPSVNHINGTDGQNICQKYLKLEFNDDPFMKKRLNSQQRNLNTALRQYNTLSERALSSQTKVDAKRLKSQGSSKTLFFALQRKRSIFRNTVDGPSDARFETFDNFPKIYSPNQKQENSSIYKIFPDYQSILIFKRAAQEENFLKSISLHHTQIIILILIATQRLIEIVSMTLLIQLVVPFGRPKDQFEMDQNQAFPDMNKISSSPLAKKNIRYLDMQEAINLQKLLKFKDRANSNQNIMKGSQTARDLQRATLTSREQEDSILIKKVLSRALLIPKVIELD